MKDSKIQLKSQVFDLLLALFTVRGNQFATIRTVTDCRLKKTGNPFPNVFKRLESQVFIGADYGNAVRNQTIREGKNPDCIDFQSRKWGERLKKGMELPNLAVKIPNDLPLVHHKGKFYIECFFIRNSFNLKSKPSFFRLENEKEIVMEKDEIESFFSSKSKSSTQSHLEREVILRDYSLDSIERIAFDGKIWEKQ